MEIIIDRTLPIRGLPFESLRNLLRGVVPHMPIRYTDALQLVIASKIILSVKKQGLKKSSFYHHWSAMRILGLIAQVPDSKLYQITERGRLLLEYAGRNENSLNEKEKTIFREAMLASQVIWDNFLYLFTGQQTPTQTPILGTMLAFKPLNFKRKYEIYSQKLDSKLVFEDERVYQLIITGLRRWGLQCSLIDEIYPPTTSKAFADVSSFMYLLDSEREKNIEIDDFTNILQNYKDYGEILFDTTIRFSIPELLSHLCLSEGIRLATAQKLLTMWVNSHPRDTALERPSSGLIQEQEGDRKQERLKESQPWLDIGNIKYTGLLIRLRVFDEER